MTLPALPPAKTTFPTYFSSRLSCQCSRQNGPCVAFSLAVLRPRQPVARLPDTEALARLRLLRIVHPRLDPRVPCCHRRDPRQADATRPVRQGARSATSTARHECAVAAVADRVEGRNAGAMPLDLRLGHLDLVAAITAESCWLGEAAPYESPEARLADLHLERALLSHGLPRRLPLDSSSLIVDPRAGTRVIADCNGVGLAVSFRAHRQSCAVAFSRFCSNCGWSFIWQSRGCSQGHALRSLPPIHVRPHQTANFSVSFTR